MASVSGSIDNFRALPDGRIMVGGWAFFDKTNKKPCSTFTYSDGGIEVHQSKRPDISEVDSFGFYFHLNDNYQLLKLAVNQSVLVASYEEQSKELGVWAKLKERIFEHLINSFVGQTGSEFQSKLLEKTIQTARSNKPALNVEKPSFSKFEIETGAVSFDSNVIVGRDNQLFLYKGSNKLHQQYTGTENSKLIDKWQQLITKRYELLSSKGIKFLQLIVPEKQSILADRYPLDVKTPTVNLRALEGKLKDNKFYYSVYNLFVKLYKNQGQNPYQNTDTHLSILGASKLVQTILMELDESYKIELGELELRRKSGDLGNKLLNGKLFSEELYITDSKSVFNNEGDLNLIEKFDPINGHSGAMRKWVNTNAPINKSVVIIGNSVCERGTSYFGLSWWLARAFENTTFCWSSAMLPKIIDATKPDYVICQTVERFLPTLPKA
jgi:hypothetical protein